MSEKNEFEIDQNITKPEALEKINDLLKKRHVDELREYIKKLDATNFPTKILNNIALSKNRNIIAAIILPYYIENILPKSANEDLEERKQQLATNIARGIFICRKDENALAMQCILHFYHCLGLLSIKREVFNEGNSETEDAETVFIPNNRLKSPVKKDINLSKGQHYPTERIVIDSIIGKSTKMTFDFSDNKENTTDSEAATKQTLLDFFKSIIRNYSLRFVLPVIRNNTIFTDENNGVHYIVEYYNEAIQSTYINTQGNYSKRNQVSIYCALMLRDDQENRAIDPSLKNYLVNNKSYLVAALANYAELVLKGKEGIKFLLNIYQQPNHNKFAKIMHNHKSYFKIGDITELYDLIASTISVLRSYLLDMADKDAVATKINYLLDIYTGQGSNEQAKELHQHLIGSSKLNDDSHHKCKTKLLRLIIQAVRYYRLDTDNKDKALQSRLVKLGMLKQKNSEQQIGSKGSVFYEQDQLESLQAINNEQQNKGSTASSAIAVNSNAVNENIESSSRKLINKPLPNLMVPRDEKLARLIAATKVKLSNQQYVHYLGVDKIKCLRYRVLGFKQRSENLTDFLQKNWQDGFGDLHKNLSHLTSQPKDNSLKIYDIERTLTSVLEILIKGSEQTNLLDRAFFIHDCWPRQLKTDKYSQQLESYSWLLLGKSITKLVKLKSNKQVVISNCNKLIEVCLRTMSLDKIKQFSRQQATKDLFNHLLKYKLDILNGMSMHAAELKGIAGLKYLLSAKNSTSCFNYILSAEADFSVFDPFPSVAFKRIVEGYLDKHNIKKIALEKEPLLVKLLEGDLNVAIPGDGQKIELQSM